MAITLAQLRTAARNEADQSNSSFVSDAELDVYINGSVAELYDLFVNSYQDYNIDSVTFTLSGSQDGYALPASIFKPRGVDYNYGGNWTTLHDFTFEQRNQSSRAAWYGVERRYRLIGNQIKFTPADQASGTYRLWFIPTAPYLVDTSDTLILEDMNKYSEYIVVDVAMKMMSKEESDVSVLLLRKQGLQTRIEKMLSGRDAGAPERVTDVKYETDLWPFDSWNR